MDRVLCGLCYTLIRCPLGCQGNIITRHDKGTVCDFHIAGLPAGKGVAGLGGRVANHADQTSFISQIAGRIIPSAAIQIICHHVTGNIFGVEVDIAVDRVRERNLITGTGFIGIPAVKGVGYAIDRFCIRIGTLGTGGLAFFIVIGLLPFITAGSGIPQIIFSGIDVYGNNLYRTVHVHIRGCSIIPGYLIRMQNDICHIVRRFHARYSTLKRIINFCPMGAVTGNHVTAAGTAVRPGHNTAGGIKAVLVAVPAGVCNINCTFSQCHFAPLISAVGARVTGRCLQIIENRTVC